MKIFGHRGYSGKYPENTMLAFEKAWQCGAHGVELDVQYTADGELVIIHDEKIDRTTNGKGLVRSYTLAELQKFDASYIYKDYGFNPIPSFEEYCKWVRDKDLITNVELKTGVYPYPGIEEKVLKLLQKYNLEDRVIISSFNHFSIMNMKKIAPHLKYGLLSETWLIDAGKYTSALDVPCYHPLFHNLTDEVVAELKAHNLEINTYTVNEAEDIRTMLAKGIDSIISNFPELALNIVNEGEK